MDKNNSFIAFLQSCPVIRSNPLFFNFGNVENDAHQVNVSFDDTALQKPYVDGSVLKRYTVYIDSFKSITTNPVISGYSAENVEDLYEVQQLLDWIIEQADNNNYPDFGSNCIIDGMTSLTAKPNLLGVDDSLNPPMAIYRITIQIDYIDNSKRLWS